MLIPCAGLPLPAQTVTVKVVGDTVVEVNENFQLNVTLGGVTKSAPVTITDDDVPVASIVSIVRVVEEDSGTTATQLAVSLSQTPVAAATISFATADGTAVSGSDYTAVSGQLVIPAGQTSGAISVPIVGDVTPEQAEVFLVRLSNPAGATLNLTQQQATVVIFDNETAPLPTVSLPKTSSANENDGNVAFNVTLSSPATQRTEVSWKTVDWTAKKPSDYTGANGKLVFQTGDRTKTISVNLKNDSRDEPDEALGVVLENPVAATLGQRGGFGLIADDDGPKMKIGKPKVRGKRLVATITCPETADSCKGKVVAKAGKLKLGRKRFAMAKGQKKTLRLKMSRKARKELAEHALRAKLTATASDGSGDRRATTRKVRLKRRR
ncbi:MAG: Calx-beta domain-containing protein [Thermoleophilaceae bacterium]